MVLNIGDKIIHVNHGLGEIVQIEDKLISGQPTSCYVFRTADLTIWIPVEEGHQNSLRRPTSPEEFEPLFAILTGPKEELMQDRVLRKDQLTAQMRDGQLSSICRLVRDLTYFRQNSKLNDQEKSILERAVNSLLTEWAYSLKIPRSQANQALEKLLSE